MGDFYSNSIHRLKEKMWAFKTTMLVSFEIKKFGHLKQQTQSHLKEKTYAFKTSNLVSFEGKNMGI
jgi:hypothetical protein